MSKSKSKDIDLEFSCVTCTAPVNIAVIKYWGKRDENLILPTNPSLSITLGQDQLRAKTSVATSPNFKEDRIWLNGVEESINNPRIQSVLKEIRRRARKRSANNKQDNDNIFQYVHIASENNFPTAAGLASSAAGYACLVYSLAKLYGVHGEISDIARLGSGSACRSMYGGFVSWQMGEQADGSDSHAVQVAAESHWPEMRALILVVSDQKKFVGSTEGMQTTIQTSQLVTQRLKLVPKSTEEITDAIRQKDFPAFAKITMRDSNQFHAVCLDTYPPIFYLNDTSKLIIRLIHSINDLLGEDRVAYTFDAGPNACLYLLEADVSRVVNLIKHFFPPSQDNKSFLTGLPVPETDLIINDLASINLPQSQAAIKYIIHTQVGPGPQEVTDPEQSLFTADGVPKV